MAWPNDTKPPRDGYRKEGGTRGSWKRTPQIIVGNWQQTPQCGEVLHVPVRDLQKWKMALAAVTSAKKPAL
ncbi:hypothetical protein SKAU_G00410740 [Synaphobranchus kaupii]|uniref:Uncharacterized protein n=1 Tax=Synaphobranchus kaupii TaxID=118154 RepID=A0A9Q1E7P6_SYNKA|nr:hypothetical protein SKAU_G00410740 [Synaphobranchus kaupii]